MDNKTQQALDLAQEIQVICKCASNENSIDDGYYKETLLQASIKAMQLAKLLENNKTQQAAQAMIEYDVLNRFTGKVQFTAKIDCEDSTPKSIKLGLAVKWAIENNADLRYADLRGANLLGADLRHADF